MDPITQAFIQGAAGASGGAGTYVDEVFNTKTYRGNATERTITTGIDLAGEGGLLWFKNRDKSNQGNYLNDTTTLPDTSSPWYSYPMFSNSTAQRGASANGLKSFNSDGFTIQTDTHCNGNNDKQVAWSFRKAPGFFDIVTWSGNDTAGRQIPHNLGSVPGCIMVKKTSGAESWEVYHRGADATAPQNYRLRLNTTDARLGTLWNNTAPTATHFTLSSANNVNGSGDTYVAYLFAGGSSTAAGSNSIFYNSPAGTVRRILCGNASNTTADFNFGTGDLTIECWIKCSASQGNYPRVVAIGPQWEAEMAALQWHHAENANRVSFYCYNHSSSTTAPLLRSPVKNFNGDGQWHHCAVTRSGNTWRLFVDGVIEDLQTWTGSTNTANSYCTIGNTPGTATTAWFGGYISNVRVVKGTAVYTDSFRPSTKPLISVTNTKLLCCNNLSATVATVTPIALTETNVNQNQTENPFDDPEGFQFGEGGDQSIVKCGYYNGNGSSTGPQINLGFEPQWVMVKRVDANADWLVWDSMRGIVTGGTQSDPMLYPNEEYAESTTIYRMDLTSRGFKITSSNGAINANGGNYIYMAIRRPDPLVGKPALVGTDVFAIDNDTNANPDFRSNFPVDFAIAKKAGDTGDWSQSARLMQGFRMYLNDTSSAEASGQSWANFDWGDPDGWSTGNWATNVYSWMWKRHAGFDVVAYEGNGLTGGQYIPHNLNAVPQMMWIKTRTQTSGYWGVYHFGLDGGTTPQSRRMQLQNSNAESITSFWNHTPPTSEMFSVGNNWTNSSSELYIAMLFASVTGISKVGYYTGTGSATTITTGFQPRFLIVKNITASNNWFVLDTTRGWGSGDDSYLKIDTTSGGGTFDFGEPTSTGFTLASGDGAYNASSNSYIYYAHA